MFFLNGESNGVVIATSMAPFDRFPNPKAEYKYKLEKPYFYFGRKYSSSRVGDTGNPLFKSIVASLYDEERSTNISHVFNELGYKPIIDVKIELRRNTFDMDLFAEYAYSSDYSPINLRDAFYRLNDFMGSRRVITLRFNFENRETNLVGDNVPSLFDDTPYISQMGSDLLMQDIAALGSVDIIRTREVFLWKGRRKIKSTEASSGELAILHTFLGIASAIKDESLIFIDEPEISLHPERQQQYLHLLDRVFSFVDRCHFIIATHSPNILATRPIDRSLVVSLGNYDGAIKPSESADYYLATAFQAPGKKNRYIKEILSKAIYISSLGPQHWEQLLPILDEVSLINDFFSRKDEEYKVINGLMALREKILEANE